MTCYNCSPRRLLLPMIATLIQSLKIKDSISGRKAYGSKKDTNFPKARLVQKLDCLRADNIGR